MLTFTELEMNLFIEGMKLGSSIALGGSVAAIAFLQFRTAHTKVALDLFERRLQVWNDVQATFRRAMTTFEENYVSSGGVFQERDIDIIHQLTRCESDARWLFGADFYDRLTELAMTCQRLRFAEDEPPTGVTAASHFSNVMSAEAKNQMRGLRVAAERYMTFGHIAVRGPERRLKNKA